MRLQSDDGSSPGRIFGLVLLLAFGAEGLIMLGLHWSPRAWSRWPWDAVLDAGVLTLSLAPALWFLAVRPLRRSHAARGRILQRLFESQEEERSRVARDLHDGVGQHLTALLVGLRAIEDAKDLEAVQARARDLREFGARAHAELRALTADLRPIALRDLGLAAAVERLCEDFERAHGLRVALRDEAARAVRLEPAVEDALYRIAQEALNNVARHAQASHVEIRLACEGGQVVLSVRDDGCGFDPHARARRDAFGLAGIRERVRMLRGTMSIRSERARGTRLEVRVPVPEGPAARPEGLPG